MAEPRGRSAIRGTIARGASASGRKGSTGFPVEAEEVKDPTRPRRVVDHTLQRNRDLHTLFHGGALSSEFCEADPYLLKAAKNHGEPAPGPCPVCRDTDFVHLTYVYGDELGPYSGRIRATDELPAMARQFGAFHVYVVEVCQKCQWNHLLSTYVLGDGVPRRALATPRDLLD